MADAVHSPEVLVVPEANISTELFLIYLKVQQGDHGGQAPRLGLLKFGDNKVEFCSLVIRVLLGLLRLQLALDLPLHPPVAAVAAELPLCVQLNLCRKRRG